MGDIFSQFTTRAGTLWAIGKPQAEAAPAGGAPSTSRWTTSTRRTAPGRSSGVEMVTEPHDEPFGRTFAFKTPDGLVMHAWQQA